MGGASLYNSRKSEEEEEEELSLRYGQWRDSRQPDLRMMAPDFCGELRKQHSLSTVPLQSRCLPSTTLPTTGTLRSPGVSITTTGWPDLSSLFIKAATDIDSLLRTNVLI